MPPSPPSAPAAAGPHGRPLAPVICPRSLDRKRYGHTQGYNNDGRQQIFVVGGDGNMHSKWQGNLNAGPWYWEGHGNPGVGLRAGIVTSTNQDGRQQIFAVGDNGSMYTKWQTTLNGGWSGWEGHGNPGAALQAVLGSHNPV